MPKVDLETTFMRNVRLPVYVTFVVKNRVWDFWNAKPGNVPFDLPDVQSLIPGFQPQVLLRSFARKDFECFNYVVRGVETQRMSKSGHVQ